MKEDIRLDILFFLYLLLFEFYQIKKGCFQIFRKQPFFI